MRVKTYDIINAGPRNRFQCDGRIVSNSGRTFQPQNLARGTLKASEVDAGIAALKAGAAGLIYSNVMEVASSVVRGCLVAQPGSKLVIADLSNIEGRMLAWLAGEEWKLQAFRDFDTMQLENGDWITGLAWTNAVLAGRTPKLALDKKGEPIRKGHDLYKLAYAKSFGVAPESVTKDQRQVGKVQELALGYASGVGGFATFAAAYGIDLDDLADKVLPVVDPELVREAEDFLEWRRKQPGATAFGMSDRAFIACETIKRGWRRGQPAIAGWWPVLEQAFRDAIDSPGYTFDCGSVKIRRDGNWLRIRMPSGRYLCYPSPAIDEQGRCSYMGMDQYTRKWQRIQTYSGKLAENVTQAASRDVLAWNMPTLDAKGYRIVLSVHDELLTETPDTDEYSSDTLAAHMSTVPPWAEGLPLAAAGFETTRYRKE